MFFYLCCSLIGYSAQSNYSDSWKVWLEKLKNIFNKPVVSVFRGKPNYSFIQTQQHVAMAAISGSEGPRTYVWGNFQDSAGSVLLWSEKNKTRQSMQMVVFWNFYHWGRGCTDSFCISTMKHLFGRSFWRAVFVLMIQLPEGLLWDSQRPRARSPLAMVERYCWLARHEMCLGEQEGPICCWVGERRMSYS